MRVLGRLIWKELNEGIILFGVLFLASPLLLSADNIWTGSEWLELVSIIAQFAIPCAVGLWAVTKSSRQRHGNEFQETHIPVHPVMQWAVSFFCPLLFVAVAGAWYGSWSSELMLWSRTYEDAMFGAALFSLCYAAGYLVSAMFNTILSSFIVLLVGMVLSAFVVSIEGVYSDDVVAFAATVFISCLLALIVGSLLFAVVLRRNALSFRRWMSGGVALLILTLGGVSAYNSLPAGDSAKPGATILVGSSSGNRRGSDVTVRMNSQQQVTGWTDVTLCNQLTKESYSRLFKQGVCVIANADDWRVYLAQQQREKAAVEVLIWDAKADTVRVVQRINPPTNRFRVNFLPWYLSPKSLYIGLGRSFISPDEHYIVLPLTSAVGNGVDLWLLDLKSGKKSIVLPNHLVSLRNAHWNDGFAILYGFGEVVRIDLKSAKAEVIKIPEGEVR